MGVVAWPSACVGTGASVNECRDRFSAGPQLSN